MLEQRLHKAYMRIEGGEVHLMALKISLGIDVVGVIRFL